MMTPCFSFYREFEADIIKRKNFVCLTLGLNKERDGIPFGCIQMEFETDRA